MSIQQSVQLSNCLCLSRSLCACYTHVMRMLHACHAHVLWSLLALSPTQTTTTLCSYRSLQAELRCSFQMHGDRRGRWAERSEAEISPACSWSRPTQWDSPADRRSTGRNGRSGKRTRLVRGRRVIRKSKTKKAWQIDKKRKRAKEVKIGKGAQ